MSENKEYILCAAVWYKELENIREGLPLTSFLPKNCDRGIVFCGHRHGQCIYTKCAVTGLRDAESGENEQGFLTNLNRFVDREEAWKIAEKANQIICQSGGYGTLYSEDLYWNFAKKIKTVENDKHKKITSRTQILPK